MVGNGESQQRIILAQPLIARVAFCLHIREGVAFMDGAPPLLFTLVASPANLS